MQFAVRHETEYRYSLPVVLAPHVLRLTPRGEHILRSRSLVVTPEPLALRDGRDAFGNPITEVTFGDRVTSELRIESRFEVETAAPALPPADARALPWGDLEDEAGAGGGTTATVDPAVAAFAQGLAAEVGHQPLPFLDHLCRTIHARADKQIRTAGAAQSAAQTLTTWRGACRDFTVLFMAAARSLGVPARFCSGYKATADTPDGRRYLHAWPEVFLRGAGWRGWDPTHGMRVTDGHVALSAAPDQEGTMPVTGSYAFSGPALTSTLDFDLRIQTT